MTVAGMRKRKNHEGRSKTTSVLCAFLPPIDGRTVIVNPSTSKDFLAFFRARYAIGSYWSAHKYFTNLSSFHIEIFINYTKVHILFISRLEEIVVC